MSAVTHLATKPSVFPAQNGEIPPLESGDRLTRAEFMRRYDAMPALKKAELIEGVVYVPSPVRQKHHGAPHSHLVGWLVTYRAGTLGVETGDNSTILLDLDNAPQPDALLYVTPEHGGRVKINEDGYIEGGPDLVAEVAASSASYDLHDKLNSYRRNGVREYVVHRVLDQQVDWLVLKDGRFEALEISPDGLFRSTVFPGLWLDPAALVRGDLATVLAVVQQGLSSTEHVTFAAGLQATPSSR
jgi:Uma2 family endonuclease